MNKITLTAIPAVALAAALALTGCGTGKSVGQADTAAPAAVEAPAPEVGTLANPAPAGTPINGTAMSGAGYSLTFPAVNGAANEQIAAANMFNEAPPAGSHYVVLTVTITNTATDPALEVVTAIDTTGINLVDAATGATAAAEWTVVTSGASLTSQPNLFPGQSATGELVFLVPDTASQLLVASDGVFVTL